MELTSRTLASFSLAAMLLLPRAGHARGDCPGTSIQPHVAVLSPAPGASSVPIDTLLWGFWQSPDVLTLRGQNGEEVALLQDTDLQSSIPLVHVLRPERLLTPGTSYTLRYCPQDACIEELTNFSTGSTTAVPAGEAVLLSQRTRQESGNPWVDLTFEFDGILAIGDASHEWAGTPREGQMIGMQDDPNDPVRLAVGQTCGGVRSGSWPYDAERVQLRFGTYNLAGEFSGWSEPQWVEVDSTACRVGAGGSPGLLVILLLAPRRRRRRR